MKHYEPTEMCTKCKGSCCSTYPGACLPEDIQKMFLADSLWESVKLALKSKRFAIDWWEGDIAQYYIRPAIKGEEGRIFHPSWGGECTFHTDLGCEIFENRPHDCKCIIPKQCEGDSCFSSIKGNTKLFHGKEWTKTGINLETIEEE